MNIIVLMSMWMLTWVSSMSAQSFSNRDARALDALLQGYAFQAMAFTNPRTGPVYDGVVPSNLTGIKVSAMRLRSGSLRTRGVSMYHEFEIPKGVLEQPYVERLVLVYHNLGNWSSTYYHPLPLGLQGYTYLTPVLGLLAYDASDLNARNLPELTIQASDRPISVHFSGLVLRPVPDGSVTKCVLVNLNGTINLSNVLADNICTTFQQGHLWIVVKPTAPAPAPALSPAPPSPSGLGGEVGKNDNNKGNNSSRVWIIVGSVVGGLALLGMLGILVVWVSKYKQGKKMHHMERAADSGEALNMTSVGNTKAPAATGTRTQPMLETEYVP